MSSQEVTLELLLGDGSNYKSWSVSIYNAFMHVDPNLRQIFSRSIFPSNISQNPSNDELRCLSLNHHACNILVDSLSRGAYFAIMSSDSDLFVDAHDLWNRIRIKYSESNCTASAPSIAYDTNLSKGEEQERWQSNDKSTSPKGSSSTSYKCLIANNDSGDESNDEEEYEDDSEDESSSPQGTFSCIASTDINDRENETDDVEEEEIRRFYTHLNKEDKALLGKLLRRNKEQDETLLRLEETLIKTNGSLEKMTKEQEELKCSHDNLVQRYDSVLIEQRNNDDALSCVAQLKMENAMLERQVEVLSHDKLALTEKYDLLSCYHDNLLDRHIMLDVAHKVVIANLNSCEPHSYTRAHLDNISSCANPGCSKESQLLEEHQATGSKEKVLIKVRNKKTKQLRRRHIAQPSQDIHGRVVKKLEMKKTAASVKLHKKDVPEAKNEEINMNLEKGKDSISHVACTDHFSMSSKNKKRKGKRRCFKCNKLGLLIVSCPYNNKDEGIRRCFGCNDKNHTISSYPLMTNQARALFGVTPTKKEDKHQASCQVKRRFCYKCGEQGHLSKVCKKGKVPKQVNLSQSYSLRRPKPYTCPRSVMRSPRTSTIAMWVPKTLMDDRYGPIPRWVPNCAN
jgi:hypothetical protein